MSRTTDERFEVTPAIVSASSTQVSKSNTTGEVDGSSVNIPSKLSPGLTYRYKVAGTDSGGNAKIKVHLKIGATQVCSIEAEAVTAKDWVAEFTVRFSSYNSQKVMGVLWQEAEDVAADYASGSVDCSAGAEMIVQIESQNSGDTVTSELCTVEKWIL